MEVHVTRRRAGASGDVGRLAGDELAAGRIEPVDEDLVEPFVGDDDEAPGAIEGTVVGMRALLLRPVRARSAGQRGQIAERSERPIRVDRQDGQAAGGVVRHGEKAVRRIDGQVHAVLAAGRLPIQHAQPARRLVDPIRRRLSPVTVGRIETPPLPIDDEKRRVRQFLQRPESAPRCPTRGSGGRR